MKNKKIYLILFAVALFAIMLFASSTDVHASDTNYVLEVETTINNWQRGSDLIFIKVDDWTDISCEEGAFKYTKTVCLKNQRTTEEYNITGSVALRNYDQYFQDGDTAKLIEKYTFTSVRPEIKVEQSFVLDTNDYLTLGSISDENDRWSNSDTWKSDYADIAFSDYSEQVTTTYYDCFYESAYNYYFYFYDGGNKTVTSSRGTVDMVPCRVYLDFSVTGNLVGPNSYHWEMSPNNSSCYSFTSDTSYVELSLSDFEQMIDNGFSVNICGTPRVDNASTSFNYGSSWSDATISSVQSNGDYVYVTLTQSGDFSVTPPNGIFYNILPFAVAGLVAIAGIVILKKNSIK